MDRRETYFRNPILTGAYPDPSICRVEDVYYMVTSSFSYFPGLPVFRSRDLVHWEQIGNAISRPEQLDFRNCGCSEGLWAATIRHHEGKFYIVCTLDVKGRLYRYNFIVTAEDPAGEWSEAVIIEGADGIDPSLYFDEDGRMWYCSNALPERLLYPEQKIIYLCELDPETLQFRGERTVIYDAAYDHSFYLEGPHIYKIGELYYLMTACGGTQTNHCVHIARSKSLTGPYEPCSRNPIVTNRNLPLLNSLGVAVTGHGDLVQTQVGEWYMVLLGIRPYEKPVDDYERYQPRQWIRTPDRNRNAQFNLGREVFLLPMTWDFDGWPLVDNENGMVNLWERFPDLPVYRPPFQSRVDNFEADRLKLFWCMRRPPKETFYSLKERPGYLRLKLGAARLEDGETPSMIVRRQQHNSFQAAAAMEFEPGEEGEEAGLTALQNERFAFLVLKQRRGGENVITCSRLVNGVREELCVKPAGSGRVYLYIEGAPGSYSFYYGHREGEMIALYREADGSLLSTLVADGFVGTYLGMYASAGGQTEAARWADFDWFRYEAVEEG